ncbi:MAG TPA: DUF1638 domain-containing protein [Desulfosalsimonadaceae bacterium]|nr:DUF1638 domain-containing protein [Desulfosalsimonadaceae bacterium]
MSDVSFEDIAIVSCGTLSLELNYLRSQGFLDADHVYYTTPGLHESPRELENQLPAKIERARQKTDKILVVYGGKFCYVNANNPTRTIDTIIAEQGGNIARINATHCMDMLASESERDAWAGGEKVLWLTPGWIKFRHQVYKGWDKGLANENFPKHTGGAMVLDGIGFMDEYMAEHAEELLEYSDWMGIPIQPYPVTLDRLKSLLLEQAEKLAG